MKRDTHVHGKVCPGTVGGRARTRLLKEPDARRPATPFLTRFSIPTREGDEQKRGVYWKGGDDDPMNSGTSYTQSIVRNATYIGLAWAIFPSFKKVQTQRSLPQRALYEIESIPTF